MTQTIPDITVALMTYLQADQSVASLLTSVPASAAYGTVGSPAIWIEELDTSMDVLMPAKTVVLRSSGGPRSPYTLKLTDERIHVLAYAESIHLAKVVSDTVKLSLKALTPSVWAHTYIHYANLATPSISMRDRNLQWPFVVTSWIVKASDVFV